ncbi:hypothetical protein Pmani_030922 [Petrolisthes manimaculis]|uniref:Uncharacterized protein n=1 Tax=Petrolisthes manimaculis TaxID=1843537 RepID=A0AAE1NWT2_9EUCA|nr:hypothetical protein Pmani_030922 [Petrolisthes manimaculis]
MGTALIILMPCTLKQSSIWQEGGAATRGIHLQHTEGLEAGRACDCSQGHLTPPEWRGLILEWWELIATYHCDQRWSGLAPKGRVGRITFYIVLLIMPLTVC